MFIETYQVENSTVDHIGYKFIENGELVGKTYFEIVQNIPVLKWIEAKKNQGEVILKNAMRFLSVKEVHLAAPNEKGKRFYDRIGAQLINQNENNGAYSYRLKK